MIKARKRFVLFAILCIFLLLLLLLGIINVVNFTMASEDADRVTEMLAQQQGMFDSQEIPAVPEGRAGELPQIPDVQGWDQQDLAPSSGEEQQDLAPSAGAEQQDLAPSAGAEQESTGEGQQIPPVPNPQGTEQQAEAPAVPNLQSGLPVGFFPGFMGPGGPMGLNSPDMEYSLRYFTFAFDKDGNEEQVVYQISAVTADEAREWARSLVNGNETGWTHYVYRYRVYESNGKTYVTVIDQGRELVPTYRILLISGIGLLVGLIVSCIALMYIGRRLFKPIEDADRKQKRFIAEAEKEFKIPLTIINANTEIMERENGETDQTLAINRQVKKMTGLVKKLSSVGVFDEKELTKMQIDVAALARAIGDSMRSSFAEKERKLDISADQPVIINGDGETMSQLISELLENALKFSLSKAQLKVGEEDGHNVIIVTNDTNLPDGNYDQVFDRFTRLDNAGDIPGVGLGLSHVKEIVQAHNGRANANAAYGVFTLRVNL